MALAIIFPVSWGREARDNAVKMASNGFFYSFLMGTAILVGGLFFLRPLSQLLGSTPTILPYTEQYMGVVLLGAPFLTSSLTLNNQLRFQGNANYAMYGIVAGAILNISLDPLFIFTLQSRHQRSSSRHHHRAVLLVSHLVLYDSA